LEDRPKSREVKKKSLWLNPFFVGPILALLLLLAVSTYSFLYDTPDVLEESHGQYVIQILEHLELVRLLEKGGQSQFEDGFQNNLQEQLYRALRMGVVGRMLRRSSDDYLEWTKKLIDSLNAQQLGTETAALWPKAGTVLLTHAGFYYNSPGGIGVLRYSISKPTAEVPMSNLFAVIKTDLSGRFADVLITEIGTEGEAAPTRTLLPIAVGYVNDDNAQDIVVLDRRSPEDAYLLFLGPKFTRFTLEAVE